MARQTPFAGGKDFPDEPRRAPVFERARQLTGDDRHHIGLEVTALVEEGADRREVGREVEIAVGRLKEPTADVQFVSNFNAR